MKCPKCKSERSKVYDTRPFGEETYRRRLCLGCGFSFVTYERYEEADDNRKPRKRRKRKE